MNGPRDLPEFRDFILSRRAALGGFMEQGAALELNGDMLAVIPRNGIYTRYLNDNCAVIADLASELYRRKLHVEISDPTATDRVDADHAETVKPATITNRNGTRPYTSRSLE